MNKKLEPKEVALFILNVLREDIGQFKWAVTPKYPLPAIIQTEGAIIVNDAEEIRAMFD